MAVTTSKIVSSYEDPDNPGQAGPVVDLDAVGGHEQVAMLPAATNVTVNTTIPATADGDTYRMTGNTAQTFTLPNLSGLRFGWRVTLVNGSPDGTTHTAAAASSQTIGAAGTLTLPAGEAVTLQKVGNSEWGVIADTGKGAAAGTTDSTARSAAAAAQSTADGAQTAAAAAQMTATANSGRIDELEDPDPFVTLDPPVWGNDGSARTFLVSLHGIRATPELAAVDKIRLSLGGSPVGTHDWTVSTGAHVVAFHLAAGSVVDNITSNVDPNDPAIDSVFVEVTLHATAGGSPASGNTRLRLVSSLTVVPPGEVPTPGSQTVFSDRPRVFHANANLTADPSDSTRFSLDFTPNEDGLTPITNSLFTFTWNLNPNLAIYRTSIAPRGTPSANATVVLISGRDSTGISNTSDLVRGTTYLARYTGATVVILTALTDDAELTDETILDLAKASRTTADRGRLLAVAAGDEDALALIDPPSPGSRGDLLVDDPANPVVASATNLDQILYRSRRLYKNVPLHYTDPTATYRDFAATDLPGGFSWGGAVQVSPSASAQPDNRVIYSIPGGHFLRKITGGGRAWWVQYTPSNWRGAFANESAADNAVRGVGEVVYFGGTVRVVATYTARTPDQFHWVPLSALWSDFDNTDRIPLDKLPVNLGLRETAGTVATPATGDRFFFSDENQAGDPIRFVQMITLGRLMIEQYLNPQTITPAAAITWSIGRGVVGNLTLNRNVDTINLSGGVDGSTALLRATQDGTGSRTLGLHTSIDRGGRAAPVLSTAANTTDLLLFHRIGTVWRYLGIIQDV